MVLNETLDTLLKNVYKHDNDLFWWKEIALRNLDMQEFEIFDGLQLLSVFGMIDFEAGDTTDLKSVERVKLKSKGFVQLHDESFIDDSDFSLLRDNYEY